MQATQSAPERIERARHASWVKRCTRTNPHAHPNPSPESSPNPKPSPAPDPNPEPNQVQSCKRGKRLVDGAAGRYFLEALVH